MTPKTLHRKSPVGRISANKQTNLWLENQVGSRRKAETTIGVRREREKRRWVWKLYVRGRFIFHRSHKQRTALNWTDKTSKGLPWEAMGQWHHRLLKTGGERKTWGKVLRKASRTFLRAKWQPSVYRFDIRMIPVINGCTDGSSQRGVPVMADCILVVKGSRESESIIEWLSQFMLFCSAFDYGDDAS